MHYTVSVVSVLDGIFAHCIFEGGGLDPVSRSWHAMCCIFFLYDSPAAAGAMSFAKKGSRKF